MKLVNLGRITVAVMNVGANRLFPKIQNKTQQVYLKRKKIEIQNEEHVYRYINYPLKTPGEGLMLFEKHDL